MGTTTDTVAGAWKYTRGLDRQGHPVVVAVVDSGVDMRHPGLRGAMWTNPLEIPGNGLDDDANGYVDDVHGANIIDPGAQMADSCGHGTMVAGVIAARPGGTDGGVVGIAYQSQIMAVRVLDSAGRGNTAGLAEGIRYAAANGAQVINISANTAGEGADLSSALAFADAQGAIVVASAGNDGRNLDLIPSFPAADPSSGVVSVAALGEAGGLATILELRSADRGPCRPGGRSDDAGGRRAATASSTARQRRPHTFPAPQRSSVPRPAARPPTEVRDVLMRSARDRTPLFIGSGTVAVDQAVAAVASTNRTSAPVITLKMTRDDSSSSRRVRVRLTVSGTREHATSCRIRARGTTVSLDMEPSGSAATWSSVGTLRSSLSRGVDRLSAVVSCEGEDGARLTRTTVSLRPAG